METVKAEISFLHDNDLMTCWFQWSATEQDLAMINVSTDVLGVDVETHVCSWVL